MLDTVIIKIQPQSNNSQKNRYVQLVYVSLAKYFIECCEIANDKFIQELRKIDSNILLIIINTFNKYYFNII